jgi:arylsulfatase A-like enzyme
VLVTIDTLRADHVGAYGGPVATPALDALAAEGALIEHAVTPTPTTGPAHASLFTGLHPWRHGVLENGVPLADETATLAEYARSHGFATAAFVSSYVLHERFEFDRGFEVYEFEPTTPLDVDRGDEEEFYSRGEVATSAAMRWLTEHTAASETPFFLWVHVFDPHAPYEPPARYALAPDATVNLAHKRISGGRNARRELAREVRAYRGEVRYVDAQLGRLIERLRILGVLDECAVIVTSDHGEGLGDHGLLRHGRNLHEELVHVPLLVRAPGVAAGTRLTGPAQLEDLLPTALALMGVPVPDGLDGLNLLRWLRGETAESPRAQVLGRRRTYPDTPVIFYQRRWPEKWIGELDAPGRSFDLASDAHEMKGAASSGAPPALLADLARLDSAREVAPQIDAEVRRALDALGYADSAQE